MLLWALSFFAFSAISHAQVLYGSLTGNVTDLTNAAVPAARVEVVNSATGVSRQGLTDERGTYTVNDLQAGTYKVTITSPGLSHFVRDGVPVEVNGTRRLDARMQVAQVSETVTVDG